jgi:hypothetical protein
MDKIRFTITIFCDRKTRFRYGGETLDGKIYDDMGWGVILMRKKNVMDWFRAMLSMAFYIGLFGCLGYLIQALIL